ncbi:hypothetical protein [Sinomonas halotolerans]|uniref:hypothetical protein n=1 Tax=Sinomonas halotolerans TaxID=1644133 RepID=UPI0031F53744
MEELTLLESEEAALAARRALTLQALAGALGGWSEDRFERAEAPAVAASEVAAALRIPQRRATAMVAEALTLTDPVWFGVLGALAAGRLTRQRALSIVDAGIPVPGPGTGSSQRPPWRWPCRTTPTACRARAP